MEKLTEEDLLADLQLFVFEQQAGQLGESEQMRELRARELTDRWQGTPVSVRVLDIEGPSSISNPHKNKSAHLETAHGEITKISPADQSRGGGGGGFKLELDEETCIEFKLQSPLAVPEDCDTGLSLEVAEDQAA